jgi:hypothetical protein
MMTIPSQSGWYYATVTDNGDAMAVEIWQNLPADGSGVAKRIHQDSLDCPFHLACEKIAEVLNQLPQPATFACGARRPHP